MGSEFMTGVLLWVEDDQNDILLVGRAMEKVGIDPPMVVRDGQEAIHYLSGQGKFARSRMPPAPIAHPAGSQASEALGLGSASVAPSAT